MSTYARKPQNHDPKSVEAPIPEIVGKTVASARQKAGDFHDLDGGYEADGSVVIEFTDGSSITVDSYWCNDSTASTEYTVKSPD